jgi:tetratricopeptide (TPR) repeat protein
MNTDRIVLFSLQNLSRRGHVIVSPEARTKAMPPIMMPDTRFIPITRAAFLERSVKYLEHEAHDKPVSENYLSGFLNFSRSAIVAYYEAGQIDKAEEYFNWLRDNYDHENFSRGLEAFVIGHIGAMSQMMVPHFTANAVMGYIWRTIELFAYGDQIEGLRYLKLARSVYDKYHVDLPPAPDGGRNRSSLAPFDQLIELAIQEYEKMSPEGATRARVLMGVEGSSVASQPFVGPEFPED